VKCRIEPHSCAVALPPGAVAAMARTTLLSHSVHALPFWE
jgi:hypothetical protein